MHCRGWFYTLLVLSTALFGKAPFKNLVVNGLVLAEDRKKMSKSLKNYPDPMVPPAPALTQTQTQFLAVPPPLPLSVSGSGSICNSKAPSLPPLRC